MSELAQSAERHELSDALEKLSQEAARLQTVIDTVPSFLWTSFPDGSKEYLNKRWYEYTGLTLEQGKGWGWKVVVHPDNLDKLVREWLALLDAPKPGELETRIRRYDGEYRWFLIRVVPQFDAEGNVVRWFGSNTDIEDRKRTEKKILGEEAELPPNYRFYPATLCRPGPGGPAALREPSNARLYRPHHARRSRLGLSRQNVPSGRSREGARGAQSRLGSQPAV